MRAKKLFTIFGYLVLVLVVAAFASIVASTFAGFTPDASGALVHNVANGRTASISMLFILLAILFGFAVYRKNAPLSISTILGVIGIMIIVVIGMKFPLYISGNVWMILLGFYILGASVTPVWILLQPRDYLSSLLYDGSGVYQYRGRSSYSGNSGLYRLHGSDHGAWQYVPCPVYHHRLRHYRSRQRR